MIFPRVHYAFAEFRGGGAGSAPLNTPLANIMKNCNTLSCVMRMVHCVDIDLLTLKPARISARGVGNLPTNLGVSWTFPSRFMGQHLSDRPRDLVTMTFDFGGHGACPSCCNRIPNLKLIGHWCAGPKRGQKLH